MQKYCYDGLNKEALIEVETSLERKFFWIHECTPRYWTLYFCIQYCQDLCLVFYADTALVSGYEECVFLCCEKRPMNGTLAHCTPPKESFPQDAKLPAKWSFLCSASAPLRIEIVHDTVVFKKNYAGGTSTESWRICANVGVIIYSNDKMWVLMTADGAPRMVYLTNIEDLEPITETWRYHYDKPEHVSADDPYSIDLVSAKRDFLPLQQCEICYNSEA